jgi:GABA permease
VGVPPVELKKGLSQRHLTMIAIGGVIGAGLFVGSGAVIKDAGPAAFLTYAVTGVLIIMVMRMLGEMAVANPSTGSFADYARRAMGGWAGFSVGWLYWYFWVIVVGFEAVAGAAILNYWFDAPLWLLSLILMVLMTATNLFSVSSFGEFEFWFAGIKVAAIVIFIGIGTLYVLGIWPNKSLDFSNLTSHGGFFPNGVGAVFSSIVVVIFSMVGAEIATIAAAESKDPARAIAKATNSVIVRIGIFFVGSVFLLAVILPWNSPELTTSPYVSAFTAMGIPYADQIMNAVVLTAVLSCLNSGMYTASRMLFVLAARREAPVSLITVNKRGVPTKAILASSVVGFLCVIAAAISPDTVFSFLLNSSGAIILFVYLLIAISQLILRRRTSPEKLAVKMWLFPFLTIATIAAILGVLVLMLFKEDTRSQLVLSLLAWAVVLVLYAVTKWRGGSVDKDEIDAPPAAGGTRVLVLANETVGASELLDELRAIDAEGAAQYFVMVPATRGRCGSGRRPPGRRRSAWTPPCRSFAPRVCTPKEHSAITAR